MLTILVISSFYFLQLSCTFLKEGEAALKQAECNRLHEYKQFLNFFGNDF